MKTDKEFDDFLKKRFLDFEGIPEENSWKNISGKIQKRNASVYKKSIAGLLILITLSTLSIFIIHSYTPLSIKAKNEINGVIKLQESGDSEKGINKEGEHDPLVAQEVKKDNSHKLKDDLKDKSEDYNEKNQVLLREKAAEVLLDNQNERNKDKINKPTSTEKKLEKTTVHNDLNNESINPSKSTKDDPGVFELNKDLTQNPNSAATAKGKFGEKEKTRTSQNTLNDSVGNESNGAFPNKEETESLDQKKRTVISLEVEAKPNGIRDGSNVNDLNILSISVESEETSSRKESSNLSSTLNEPAQSFDNQSRTTNRGTTDNSIENPIITNIETPESLSDTISIQENQNEDILNIPSSQPHLVQKNDNQEDEQIKKSRKINYKIFFSPRYTFRRIQPNTEDEVFVEKVNGMNNFFGERLGFETGLIAEKQLSKRWSILLGLSFVSMKEKIAFRATSGIPDSTHFEQNSDNTFNLAGDYKTEDISYKSTFYYSGISLGSQYTYWKSDRKSFYFSFGGGVNLLIKGKTQIGRDDVVESEIYFPSPKNPLEQMNFRIHLSPGYSFQINPKRQFFFEPTLNYFLGSTYQKREPIGLKPYTLGLNFGIKF